MPSEIEYQPSSPRGTLKEFVLFNPFAEGLATRISLFFTGALSTC